MRHTVLLGTPVLLCAVGFAACDHTPPLAFDDAQLAAPPVPAFSASKKLDVDRCAFGQTFTLDPGHPYYPLAVGDQWSLEGEEDGALVELQVTVLDEVEIVGGVTTRVVEEREWEDGELLEVSRNYIAGAEDGTICYFGEAVDVFENGTITHPGEWRADAPGFFPGILMPAHPRPGMKFLMEGAPGIAQDQGTIVGIGPIGGFRETVRIRESNPLDGDKGFKVFARGVGIVVDGPLSLVSYTGS